MLLPFVAIEAQEVVVPANSVNTTKLSPNKSADTLELPFFDDFSDYTKFGKNFSDKNVAIAYNSCILPPSIGAIMFDAVDSAGNYYATNYGQALIADYLTSKPLNLASPNDEEVFMSFWYEPKGNLDAPETNDSLILQFFAPSQDKWINVWTAENYTNAEFRYVILQISDTAFLQKGFKFRFYNRVSMGSSSHPDMVANCDQWFVDYIYINKNRSANDTISHDVAFQYPIRLKFDDYTTIPYEHYKAAYSDINHNLYINFRNNDNKIRQIDSMYIVFRDKINNLSDDTLYLGSYNFGGQSDLHIDKSQINFNFPIGNYDYLDYKLHTKLVTDTYDSTMNNIVVQNKKLAATYSYDDRTAENAYGLIGDALYALVAQKYYAYKDDELIGMEVYFNKVFKDAQPYYFYAMVWDNDENTGMPGDLLYEQEGMEIDHQNLNHFQVFEFDEPVAVSDTFYIGWKKTVENMMNVGIDVNSTTLNYKYYNLYNGEWQKSTIDGVLMMHPIFGNVAWADINETQVKITIYPNPVQNLLNIQLSDIQLVTGSIQIFDVSGRVVTSQNFETDKFSIDVSNLTQGVYILQINTEAFTQKLKFVKK